MSTLCRRCDYDLSHSGDVCPECGTNNADVPRVMTFYPGARAIRDAVLGAGLLAIMLMRADIREATIVIVLVAIAVLTMVIKSAWFGWRVYVEFWSDRVAIHYASSTRTFQRRGIEDIGYNWLLNWVWIRYQGNVRRLSDMAFGGRRNTRRLVRTLREYLHDR